MKLIIENWNNFLQEQIDWEPTNSENIAQHIKLGKEHIIKYTHYLGKKALQSGKDEDAKLLTTYWNSFNDKHPEIRDIFAKYMKEFYKSKKQQDYKNTMSDYAKKLKASDEKQESIVKAFKQSMFVTKIVSQKVHENRMKALQTAATDPAKSKEFQKRASNFDKIIKILNNAVQSSDFQTIEELYKNFGGQ